MEAWFKFKGRDSREFGILISAMPDVTKPLHRTEEITIPGRNGSLTVEEGCYDSYILSIECGKRGVERLDDMLAWLDGSGDLILFTEPNKVYKARIANAIPIRDVVYLNNSFLIQFKVFPFKYAANAFGDGITLATPQTIYSKGTIYSEPLITVHGTGSVALTISGRDYCFAVDGWITIDSEQEEAYKGHESRNNAYQAMEFPRFEVGANDVSWTGNVEKIEIEPRWRYL